MVYKKSVRAVLLSLCLVSLVAAGGGTDTLRLIDLDGAAVDPLGDARATVFVFSRTDCPISNRYAPELRRLYESFVSRGVRFWLVYPDPDEPVDAIRRHLADYDYPMAGLRDPRYTLVDLTEATVTPEVVLFDEAGTLVYRGRIDDRYVDFGKTRAAPTTHDLAEALEAVLDGRPVPNPRTRAIGCYIPDTR
jgi:hypothetical protein